MFLQETFVIQDCAFIDMFNSIVNNNWWNNNNNISVSTENDVKVLSTTSSSNQYAPATEPATEGSKIIYFNPSFICEFDVTFINSSWYMQIYDGSNNQSLSFNSIGHYKIEYDGSTAKFYKDDTLLSTKWDYNNLSSRFNLQCWSSGMALKFKNLKIYPV